MKAGQMVVDRHPGHVAGRVVAEHHQLDALQAQYPVGFRPAAIVADAHADHSAKPAPGAEAQVADVEVTLLQVLERIARAMVGVAGQMHLAVLAHDAAVLVGDNGSVVVANLIIFMRALGEAEVEPHPAALGFLEQRKRAARRHLVFEEAVDLLLVLHPPAREERGQRQLGIDDEVAFHCVRLTHQLEQPAHNHFTIVISRVRTKLRGSHGQYPAHPRVLLGGYTRRRREVRRANCRVTPPSQRVRPSSVRCLGESRAARKKCDLAAHRGQGNLAAMSIIAWNFSSIGLRGVG